MAETVRVVLKVAARSEKAGQVNPALFRALRPNPARKPAASTTRFCKTERPLRFVVLEDWDGKPPSMRTDHATRAGGLCPGAGPDGKAPERGMYNTVK